MATGRSGKTTKKPAAKPEKGMKPSRGGARQEKELPQHVVDDAVAGANADTPAEAKEQAKDNALEIAAVSKLQEAIKQDLKRYEEKHKEWGFLRRSIVLDPKDEEIKRLVNVKILLSTLTSLVPHVYAQDPEVACKPAESVDPARYKVMKQLARTCEIVVDRDFKDGNLKRQGKRAVRAALTTGVGWIKVGTQTVNGQDPIILNRIEDAQAKIKEIEGLIQKMQDGDEGRDQYEADKARLVDLQKSLEAQVDVIISKGFVFDVVAPEDLIPDCGLRELIDYEYAEHITHRIWMRKDGARTEFALSEEELATCQLYSTRASKGAQDEMQKTKDGEDPGEWLCVYETWDKVAETIYTTVEGLERYAKAPFIPEFVSRRFYSFFRLVFNDVDGQYHPVSDVESWEPLQGEFNGTRSSFSELRRRSIPARLFDKTGMTPDEVKRLEKVETNEMVGVTPPPNVKLSEMIMAAPNPAIDLKLFDTTPIRADIETQSKLQDADRAYLGRTKTAAEANIQEAARMSSVTERNLAVEETVGEIARYIIEIGLLGFYSQQDVQRIAGPGAVWPSMPRQDVYRMLDIDIRPGTSGRPNQLAEQQAWAVLEPMTEKSILQIAQLRQQGQIEVAESMEELLRETFRRADERLDPDDFIPQFPDQPGLGAPNNASAPSQPNGPGIGVSPDGRIVPLAVEPAGLGPRVSPSQSNTGNLGAP